MNITDITELTAEEVLKCNSLEPSRQILIDYLHEKPKFLLEYLSNFGRRLALKKVLELQSPVSFDPERIMEILKDRLGTTSVPAETAPSPLLIVDLPGLRFFY